MNRLFRKINYNIHTGIGYNTGDGCDIEAKVLEFFKNKNGHPLFKVIYAIRVETTKNIYTFGLFSYHWHSKKEGEPTKTMWSN